MKINEEKLVNLENTINDILNSKQIKIDECKKKMDDINTKLANESKEMEECFNLDDINNYKKHKENVNKLNDDMNFYKETMKRILDDENISKEKYDELNNEISIFYKETSNEAKREILENAEKLIDIKFKFGNFESRLNKLANLLDHSIMKKNSNYYVRNRFTSFILSSINHFYYSYALNVFRHDLGLEEKTNNEDSPKIFIR